MKHEEFKREVLPMRNDLLFYAKRILDDSADAEDIVQEVFLKLWYMRDELGQYRNLQALSVTMTKHLCLNRLKVKERKQEEIREWTLVNDTNSPEQELEQKDNVAHVLRIIEQLPSLQQTILRMKHVDGYEVEEIAELTGTNADAVRMNLSRGRKKVRDIFMKMQA